MTGYHTGAETRRDTGAKVGEYPGRNRAGYNGGRGGTRGVLRLRVCVVALGLFLLIVGAETLDARGFPSVGTFPLFLPSADGVMAGAESSGNYYALLSDRELRSYVAAGVAFRSDLPFQVASPDGQPEGNAEDVSHGDAETQIAEPRYRDLLIRGGVAQTLAGDRHYRATALEMETDVTIRYRRQSERGDIARFFGAAPGSVDEDTAVAGSDGALEGRPYVGLRFSAARDRTLWSTAFVDARAGVSGWGGMLAYDAAVEPGAWFFAPLGDFGLQARAPIAGKWLYSAVDAEWRTLLSDPIGPAPYWSRPRPRLLRGVVPDEGARAAGSGVAGLRSRFLEWEYYFPMALELGAFAEAGVWMEGPVEAPRDHAIGAGAELVLRTRHEMWGMDVALRGGVAAPVNPAGDRKLRGFLAVDTPAPWPAYR